MSALQCTMKLLLLCITVLSHCKNNAFAADENCGPGFYGINCKEHCPYGCATCLSNSSCLECKAGHYGATCNLYCPWNCKAQICDRLNGSCIQGCLLDYYTGDRCCINGGHCKVCVSNDICAECLDGFYGEQCDIECTSKCIDGTCDKGDGRCKQECKSGYYGGNCSQICPPNCKRQLCDKVTGSCTQGCKLRRYSGDRCCVHGGLCKVCESDDICVECMDGFYGEQCDKQCPDTCADGHCEKGNGTCRSECKNGYYGEYCTQICPRKCKNQICDKGNGSCTQGCRLSLYSGDRCCTRSFRGHCKICENDDTCAECLDGFYGKSCHRPCLEQCADGTCDKGDGRCEQECKNGYYGDNCTQECPLYCKDQLCDKDSGSCTQGCTYDFYSGDNCCLFSLGGRGKCKTCSSDNTCAECMSGFYGYYCDKRCSSHCNGNVCNRTTGTCSEGCLEGYTGDMCCISGGHCQQCTSGSECKTCQPGYFGKYCNQTCSPGCRDDSCDKIQGNCLNGCRAGFTGDKCCQENGYCNTCKSNDECGVCQTGYFGQNCHETCSFGCRSGICHRKNSSCKCKKDYSGDKCCGNNTNCRVCLSTTRCSECKQKLHGNDCEISCPKQCFSDICDKQHGTCSECKRGYYGSTCEIKCPSSCYNDKCRMDGTCFKCYRGCYGSTCSTPCSSTCRNNNCSINGYCVSCKDGYYGKECETSCHSNCLTCLSENQCTKCKNGFHGEDCSCNCPSDCVNCTNGGHCGLCKPGFKGDTCSETCSLCKTGTACGQSDGYCIHACKDGFSSGDCSLRCPSNCRSCYRDYANYCTACSEGRFGKWYTHWLYSQQYSYCDTQCSPRCLHGMCDERTGHCLNCTGSFHGDLCDTCLEPLANPDKKCSCRTDVCIDARTCYRCRNATWYPDAQSRSCCPCSNTCKNNTCSGEDACTHGCVDGYYGAGCKTKCSAIQEACEKCSLNDRNRNVCEKCRQGFYLKKSHCRLCSESCLNSTCDTTNGRCTEGCIEGRWGSKCDCLPGHVGESCSKGFEQAAYGTTDVWVYVGVLTGVVLLVAAGVVAVVYMRRRNRRTPRGSPEAASLANVPNQHLEMAEIDPAYVNIFGSDRNGLNRIRKKVNLISCSTVYGPGIGVHFRPKMHHGIREADRRAGGATREDTPMLEELRTKLATVGTDTDPCDSTYDQPDQIAPPAQSTYEQVDHDTRNQPNQSGSLPKQSTYEQVDIGPSQGTFGHTDPEISIYEQDSSEPSQSIYEQLDSSIPERTYRQLHVQPSDSTYEIPVQTTTQASQSTYEQLDREQVGRDIPERTYEQLDHAGGYVNAGIRQYCNVFEANN